MEVGDDQRRVARPEERPVGEQDERLAGNGKGGGGGHAAAMTCPASGGKQLSPALPGRRGIALPRLAPRAARHVEHDALVGKIYLNAVEEGQAIHAQKKRRPLVETEGIERL